MAALGRLTPSLPQRRPARRRSSGALRIQQNSVEQLVVFLPALFLFAHYVDPTVAAAIGTIFLLGRIAYQWAYSRGANRGPGFGLSFLANIVLAIGALVGILFGFNELP